MKTKLLLYLVLLLGLSLKAQIMNVASGLALPTPIFIDGNDLYVAEINLDRVTKFDATLLNQTSGTNTANGINIPYAMVRYGNFLYLSQNIPGLANKIIKVDLTVPGAPPTNYITGLNYSNGNNTNIGPAGMVLIGNYLYFSDYPGTSIYKVDLNQTSPTVVSVVTGIDKVWGLAAKGNDLYISQNYGDKIFKIDVSQTTPILQVVATGLGNARSIAVNCNYLFFSQEDTFKISYIDLSQSSPVPVDLLTNIISSSVAIKGDYLFFNQYGSNEVSKIDISSLVALPTFTQIGPICSGTILQPMPTTSNNNITGTWSPTLNNTATTTYTFTPDTGQCATTTTMTIVVNPVVTPTFSAIAPICSGTTVSPLQSQSNDNPAITGTWSPAFNGVATTTYTFTPTSNPCATTTTLTVNVIPTTNTQNINVSTGVNNSGINVTVGAPDPNWQILGNPSVPTPIVCNFISGNWQPTPVTGTNAGWINDTGVNSGANSPLTYTFERPFAIATGTTSFSCNFALAWDDQLISFELVRPDLTTIPIAVVPASNVNLFSSPILNTVTNPMVGTWKIRAVVFFLDSYAGFLLSGNIAIVTPSGTVPTFTQIAPICSGSALAPLPTSSINNPIITGTWSPTINNTATTTYTFTPDVGQCATTTTMTIVVNPVVTPTFNEIAPVCSGTTVSPLQTTSNNNIVGTWSPAFNGSATTTYTFTPNPGQCAISTTLTIVVNPIVTPTFAPIGNVCTLTTVSPLQTTSLNGITGTWSPAFSNATTPFNLTTTVYTFTPNAGQCGTTTNTSVTVYPLQDIFFIPIDPICAGATLIPPPNTSLNGVTGTWSPAFNNTVTTTYTFTPDAGYCSVPRTLTITVNPSGTPIFTQVAPICSGTTVSPLPTTSNNNIVGTWSPAFNGTATTTYTFTPTANACATTTTMTITVNVAKVWYLDNDNDTYGNPLISTLACTRPTGYVSDNTDCNDSNAAVNPNHVEVPGNGIDDNCNGIIDEVLPPVRVIPQQCGITLTSLWDSIFSTQPPSPIVATSYRFELSNTSLPYLQTFDTPQTQVPINRCSIYNFTGILPGTTYTVRVAIKVNGFWQAYGPPCTITTPVGITTALVPQSCGITTSTSWTSLFVNPVNPPSGSGYSTTGYRVRVVNNCTNPPTTSYLLLTPPTTVFNLRNNAFAPLVPLSPNCTYTISVQLQLNGVWQTNAGGQDLYGSSCVLTTSSTYQRLLESTADNTDFKALAYPNPYTDEFNLDISTLNQNGLAIKIYDMMGRMIESHQATATDLSTIPFGKNYASGVYNVIVTQGENVKTLRVIKR